ncbi:Glycoside hydrolase family 32 [Carpediemonas membranifera]|uniref:beta-fructofuranosidase n=1 Tax=Carpediemonas membranifera TaxID=201153 RepID=A0A8J6E1K4_9EUKA|nr:Glycoside hydrolase family 32 [Carpediemonas membranifera]|eukprot:KAG9393176.1 Glycoside hydrolase family 32 [Carpediemonas membranifera]
MARIALLLLLATIAIATVPFATTTYHFHALKGWINDPNGLIYVDGQHHWFFQLNPDDVVWGNIHWGHAVSTDLLKWTILDNALTPNSTFDANGCWSGGAYLSDNNSTINLLYTCVNAANEQQQCVATSTDGKNFTKSPANPVLPTPANILPNQFRDPQPIFNPTTEAVEGVVIGAGSAQGGLAQFYHINPNATEWTLVGTMMADDDTRDFECPDLIIDGTTGRAAFCVSLEYEGKTHHNGYFLGTWDEGAGSFTPTGDAKRLEHGDMYAPRSYLVDGRRLLVGWLNDEVDSSELVELGYAGAMTVPREVTIDSTGLHQRPADEIAAMLSNTVSGKLAVWGTEPLPISGHALWLELVVAGRGNTTVHVMHDSSLGEDTRVVVNPDMQAVIIERADSSSLALNGTVTTDVVIPASIGSSTGLVILVDGSIVEVFVDETSVGSAHIYPSKANRGGALISAAQSDVRYTVGLLGQGFFIQ